MVYRVMSTARGQYLGIHFVHRKKNIKEFCFTRMQVIYFYEYLTIIGRG